MKDITIDIFDVKSIDDAIRHLDMLEQELPNLEDRVTDQLTEIGAEVAGPIFANAPYDGDNDVSVGTTKSEHGTGSVDAYGKAAGFIEFGTGINVGEGPTLPRPQGWGLGEYGKKQGAHPPWVYHGSPGQNPATGRFSVIKSHKEGGGQSGRGTVMTFGNPPAGALMTAGLYIEELASGIVKGEVDKL